MAAPDESHRADIRAGLSNNPNEEPGADPRADVEADADVEAEADADEAEGEAAGDDEAEEAEEGEEEDEEADVELVEPTTLVPVPATPFPNPTKSGVPDPTEKPTLPTSSTSPTSPAAKPKATSPKPKEDVKPKPNQVEAKKKELERAPISQLQTKTIHEYQGQMDSICARYSDRRDPNLPFSSLRWDTDLEKGQIRDIDEERVRELKDAILTDRFITEPVTVIVWHDSGMSCVRINSIQFKRGLTCAGYRDAPIVKLDAFLFQITGVTTSFPGSIPARP
jgi:hypothetical protein